MSTLEKKIRLNLKAISELPVNAGETEEQKKEREEKEDAEVCFPYHMMIAGGLHSEYQVQYLEKQCRLYKQDPLTFRFEDGSSLRQYYTKKGGCVSLVIYLTK